MEPYRYLEEVARRIDTLDDREEITTVLDELEFPHEALEPEFQDLASDLMARLSGRLAAMP